MPRRSPSPRHFYISSRPGVLLPCNRIFVRHGELSGLTDENYIIQGFGEFTFPKPFFASAAARELFCPKRPQVASGIFKRPGTIFVPGLIYIEKRKCALILYFPLRFFFTAALPLWATGTSVPVARANSRRMSFCASVRCSGVTSFAVTNWSPRPLPRI